MLEVIGGITYQPCSATTTLPKPTEPHSIYFIMYCMAVEQVTRQSQGGHQPRTPINGRCARSEEHLTCSLGSLTRTCSQSPRPGSTKHACFVLPLDYRDADQRTWLAW